MKSWWRRQASKAAGVLALLVSATASGFCYEEAGQKYGINPLLLEAIAMQESGGKPGAVSPRNKDGTRDYSLMQINSWWLDKLAAYGVSKDDLFNPCQSVHAGAWVLAQAIQLMGNNWEAVGAYNAGPAKDRGAARKAYATKVWKQYMKLLTERMSKEGKEE